MVIIDIQTTLYSPCHLRVIILSSLSIVLVEKAIHLTYKQNESVIKKTHLTEFRNQEEKTEKSTRTLVH